MGGIMWEDRYNELGIDEVALKELIRDMEKDCWIEDGVSDLVMGWIEPELSKVGFGFVNDELEKMRLYDELSEKISGLCKDFIRGITELREKEKLNDED